MGDDVDPRRVLQRFNERIGKTQDPFARMKLEEYRNDLQESINEADAARKQYTVVATGHKHTDNDVSAAMANEVEQTVEQAARQLENIAAFFDAMLDAAEDPDTDLREWLRAQQEQQLKQAQAAQAQMLGLNQ